jgi:hypothetical protein
MRGDEAAGDSPYPVQLRVARAWPDSEREFDLFSEAAII